jgi:protein transport protein SEC31
VTVSQMVSEPELLNRASTLDSALSQGLYSNFCSEQAQTASQDLTILWNYLGAQFEAHPQSATLTLLGYPLEKLNASLDAIVGENVDQLANDVSQLSTNGDISTEGIDNTVRLVFLCHNLWLTTVYLCSFRRSTTNLWKKLRPLNPSPFQTLKVVSKYHWSWNNVLLVLYSDPDGQIGQALLLGRLDAAVEMCMKQNMMADALLLAMTGGTELLARTQQRYFKVEAALFKANNLTDTRTHFSQQSKGWLSHLISAVVSQNWASLISTCNPSSWAQLLAGVITHTNGEDFYYLCRKWLGFFCVIKLTLFLEQLGEKLEAQPDYKQFAQVCYLCSGNVEKLVSSWENSSAPTSSLHLQVKH